MIFVAALILAVYTFFGGIILQLIADVLHLHTKWWWCFGAVAAVVLVLFGIFGVEAVSPISC